MKKMNFVGGQMDDKCLDFHRRVAMNEKNLPKVLYRMKYCLVFVSRHLMNEMYVGFIRWHVVDAILLNFCL